jgi:hypothetical protein
MDNLSTATLQARRKAPLGRRFTCEAWLAGSLQVPDPHGTSRQKSSVVLRGALKSRVVVKIWQAERPPVSSVDEVEEPRVWGRRRHTNGAVWVRRPGLRR